MPPDIFILRIHPNGIRFELRLVVGSNVVQDRLPAFQWPARPAAADHTEEDVFNGIPFTCAGGIMDDGDLSLKGIGQGAENISRRGSGCH